MPQDTAVLDGTGALRDEPFDPAGVGDRARPLLVVDDNADMRDYLCRVLEPYWCGATAVDGRRRPGRVAAQPSIWC